MPNPVQSEPWASAHGPGRVGKGQSLISLLSNPLKVYYLPLHNGPIVPARFMHRFLSRSDENADLSALRHARQRPPQTYCMVR